MNGPEAGLGKLCLNGRGKQVGEQLVGSVALGGFAEDDGALLDVGVEAIGNDGVGSAGGEARGEGGGEGDEAGVGVAGVNELGGLGYVLGGDEAGLELVVKVKAGEGGDGGAAIGCAVGVGEGESAEVGAAQQIEGGRREARVFARPEDERAAAVEDGCGGVGEAGGDEAAGVAEVGGEKKVKGRPVLDLGGQHGGGLEGGFSADAGGLLELFEDGRQNGLEVSRGGDTERGLGAERAEREETDEGEEEFAGHGKLVPPSREKASYADRLAPQAPSAVTCFGSGVLW